jgi:hypothetical protein
VSNSILDKPGPLGAAEWERIRFQPYVTERMRQQSAALSPPGAIAVQRIESVSTDLAIRGPFPALGSRCRLA